jgi:hypothetical protein
MSTLYSKHLIVRLTVGLQVAVKVLKEIKGKSLKNMQRVSVEWLNRIMTDNCVENEARESGLGKLQSPEYCTTSGPYGRQ